MRKMRQRVNGGTPSFRQKTPDACGETPTLSEVNLAPVAFNLNQMSALVLPLVSDSKKLIWVHSNQVNLKLDGAEELDKAFSRFPYLTQNQTAALAQRCSLQPDQVKVWFMIQRLHYGISWDYKDILEVRRKIKSSWGNEELQKDRGENDTLKREGKESGGKKAGEVRKEQSANEGRMMGERMRDNQPWERGMKPGQPLKEEKDRKVEELEEDKRNTQKKRKRMTVPDKIGKKRRADEGVVERAEEVEITRDNVKRESTKSKPAQSETTLVTRKKKRAKSNKRLLSFQEWPAHKSFVVHDEALDLCPLLIPLKKNPDAITDVDKVRELKEVTNYPLVDASAWIRCLTKRQTQLAMMKMAFMRCQYPDSEDYGRLGMLIGVPRYMLVQWFSDMRYYVKKGKPRWMNEEQHSQALANIKYRQCLNTLSKLQHSEAEAVEG